MSLTGTTRQQVAQAHVQIALQHDPNVLVATALRTKSRHAREILAEAAWPGHGPAEIHAWAEDGSSPIAQGMDIPWLGRFAQVVALQAIEPDSFELGRAVLEPIAQARRLAELPDHIVELLLQLRLAARDQSGVEALLEHPAVRPEQRDAVEADLLNPRLFSGRNDAEWLAAVNRALRSPDIAEVTVEPIAPDKPVSVFDRLATTQTQTQAIESERCITVLMSCYRPGPALLTAVRSVIHQTWANWELLIIDDASGPEYDAILDQASQLDPRVRVIRKALNGGTYRARNTALRQAAGEFCTVVDSDDWAHPQKLERLVRPMLERPELMGTIGRAVRVSEDFELNIPGLLPRIPSAPSLMFRTLPVCSRVGFFDTTSKAADTEFRKRLELAFGTRVRVVPQVLYFLRTGDTLSSSEISRGWKHPARRSYRQTYEAWHENIASEGWDPFLDPDDGRKFPEPRRWAKPTTPALGPPAHVSLCVAGDWRAAQSARSMLDEVHAALDVGRRVAVMHLDDLQLMTRRDMPLVAPIMELISSGAVEWIQPDDNLDVDDLMIHDPSVLQYPPTIGKPLRVSNVVIDVDPSSAADSERAQLYCVADVTERCAELFGVPPVWGRAPEPAAAVLPSTAAPPSELGPASDGPVVEVRLDASGTTPSVGVTLDEVTSARYRVKRIPLRSLADAEGHDEVVVAYRHGADQVVTRWLQPLNDSHPAGARTHILLDSVPEEVVLIMASCDGLVLLSSQHAIRHEVGGADLLGLTGVDLPPSWSAAAWWASSRPRQIRLV